jgi:hypothetical protein
MTPFFPATRKKAKHPLPANSRVQPAPCATSSAVALSVGLYDGCDHIKHNVFCPRGSDLIR